MKLARAVTFNLLAMLGVSTSFIVVLMLSGVTQSTLLSVIVMVVSLVLTLWLGHEYCYDECGEVEESVINENLSDINDARFEAEMCLLSIRSEMVGESYSGKYKNDIERMEMCLSDIELSIRKEKRK